MDTLERLAINGGEKVRIKPFPTVNDQSGRWIGEEEKQFVMEVLESGHLFGVGGKFVTQFERAFAEYYGIKSAVSSSSGTAALHIALGALEVGPGDEIITTPITDMGTVIAILLCNAIPIFADVDPLTGNLSPQSIEKYISQKTKGIIAVHLFGQPCDMDAILAIADKYHLWVVEDCCQAHAAEYKGKKVGTFGIMGCFSFQQSKQITTGDGGMTISNDEQLGYRAKLFSDKGWPRDKSGRGHLFLAPNYRMTELQAAVGLAQLYKLDAIVATRRKTAEQLTSLIRNIPGVNPPKMLEVVNPSYWMYSFTVDEQELGVSSQEFQQALAAEGIPVTLGYIPKLIFEYDVIKEQKTYGKTHCPFDCERTNKGAGRYRAEDYPNALWSLKHWLCISWNEGISESDVQDIATAIRKVATVLSKSHKSKDDCQIKS
ncbi:MAG: DegT/DnrJ/EryC1/StrS family aminotransferase [bacterium]|nr:DegT/DnrJ/EryC1/StrS family aminotransferase [bacterium]